eukprot:5965126-Amphidinium_carterae.1
MTQSNRFGAWRQLILHYAGGHRAQQFYLAQLCNQAETQQQNNSHDNTTSGWKTLTDTNHKVDKEPSQTM